MTLPNPPPALLKLASVPLHDNFEGDDTWVGGPWEAPPTDRKLKGGDGAIVKVSAEKRRSQPGFFCIYALSAFGNASSGPSA